MINSYNLINSPNIQINVHPIKETSEDTITIFDSSSDESIVPQDVPLTTGTTTSLFSLEKIQGYLQKLGLDEEKWSLHYLEDALIQQLLSVLESKDKPCFEQIEAFCSLIRLLRPTDTYNSSEFTHIFKVFNKEKSLSPISEIYICLLANARTLLGMTLGKIFGKKQSNKETSLFLSAKTQNSCIKNTIHYTNAVCYKLGTAQKNNLRNIPTKNRNVLMCINKFDSASQKASVFEARCKIINSLISQKTLFSSSEINLENIDDANNFINHLNVYFKLTKNLATKLIDYLILEKEFFSTLISNIEKEEYSQSQGLKNLQNEAKSLEMDALEKINSNIKNLNEREYKLKNRLNEIIKSINENPGGDHYFDSIETSITKQAIEEINDTLSKLNEYKNTIIQQNKLYLPKVNENINSSKKNLLEGSLITDGIKPFLKDIDQKKEILQSWLVNQEHFLSVLIEKYRLSSKKITHDEIDGKPLWLFYGDELIDDEIKAEEKKLKSLKSISSRKNTIQTVSSSESSSEESSLVEKESFHDLTEKGLPLFLEMLPKTNRHLSKEIKKHLENQLSSIHSETVVSKATKASKELRDHMHYATLNLMLFTEALLNGDFQAIGSIIPSLCMDLHIQIEQWLKHSIILAEGSYPETHSLVALANKLGSSLKLTSRQNEFLDTFDYGMIQARYPVASLRYYQTIPEVLHWIHFALDASRGKDLFAQKAKDELSKLIAFVFDSYKDAQSFLREPFESSSKEFIQMLDFSKIELQKMLSNINSNKLIDFKTQKGSVDFSKKIKELQESLIDTKIVNYPEPLKEASNHLLRLEGTCHLKKNYTNSLFAPLHQRNALIIQWAIEQLYVCQGIAEKVGDLRWVQNHDLCVYHSLLHEDQSRCKALKAFNFGRTVHYNRDRQKESSLPMIQNILTSLKCSKLNRTNKLSDQYWNVIFQKGIPLLDLLIKETL